MLLSLSRCSGFIPEQIQDVLLAVASMACGGLHKLLRLLSLHLCNECPSLPPKKKASCVPEALTQKQPSQGSRVSETARGESRKRGCLSQLTASRPHLYPDVMRLSIRHSDHTDAHGNSVHGCKHLHGPALSQTMKDWVRTSLFNGSTTQRILKQHAKSAMPPINSNTADTDCFLNSQDIRNIAQKLA